MKLGKSWWVNAGVLRGWPDLLYTCHCWVITCVENHVQTALEPRPVATHPFSSCLPLSSSLLHRLPPWGVPPVSLSSILSPHGDCCPTHGQLWGHGEYPHQCFGAKHVISESILSGIFTAFYLFYCGVKRTRFGPDSPGFEFILHHVLAGAHPCWTLYSQTV